MSIHIGHIKMLSLFAQSTNFVQNRTTHFCNVVRKIKDVQIHRFLHTWWNVSQIFGKKVFIKMRQTLGGYWANHLSSNQSIFVTASLATLRLPIGWFQRESLWCLCCTLLYF